MRVVFWGTYDTGKPRTRILLRGLREVGVDVVEIHADVWGGVEDKGRITGAGPRFRYAVKWLAAYPGLIWRYLRAPRHDAVIVGYMGHLDVLVLWPFAVLRRTPLVWDAFLSLYDTVVEDRRIVGRLNPLAWGIYAWEWLACRAADRVVLDTAAHAAYFAATYRLAPRKLTDLPVGVEPKAFPPAPAVSRDPLRPLTVLFYGQFIPLHGIDTIVRAAQAAHDEPIDWILIGKGQEEARIRALIAELPARIEWIPWVEYKALAARIAAADLCLGIFGDTGKAARVIPNKVYQIVAAGAPLVTRDSPAIRELLEDRMPGVYLVPPADPEALLAAVRRYVSERDSLPPRPLRRGINGRIVPAAIGAGFVRIVKETLSNHPPVPTTGRITGTTGD